MKKLIALFELIASVVAVFLFLQQVCDSYAKIKERTNKEKTFFF